MTQSSWALLAYFGPEVQLPLISFLGVIMGALMIVGQMPIRLAKNCYRRIATKISST